MSMGASGDIFRVKLSLRDEFQSRLIELARERHLREDIIETQFGPECAWAQYERAEMLILLNERRTEWGKAPISQEEVDRVERQACGHVDYAPKFALYCAELVLL